MLVIRDAQIQALIAASDDDLERLVEDAVRKVNPLRVDGPAPARVKSMVQIGIERAREAGFQKAEDLAVFVALMFEISPQFYEQPAIAAVLKDATYQPEDRLEQLFERVPDAAWSEAVDLYDEKIWFTERNNEEVSA
jgi:hypothetical protein